VAALKAVLAVLMAGLLGLFGWLTGQSETVRQLTITYSLALAVSGLLIDWVFMGLQRMQYIGVARVLQYLTYPLLLVLWVREPADVLRVPVASTLAALVAVLCLAAVFARQHPQFRLRPRLQAWPGWLRLTLPLAVSVLVIQLTLNAPILMLGWMRGEEATGYYAGAFRVTQILQELGALFLLAFNPVVAQRWREAPETVGPLLERVLKMLVAMTAPIAMSSLLVGPQLLTLVLGAQFQASALPFQIIVWTTVIAAVNGVYAQLALLMNGKQREYLAVMGLGAALSLVLNLALIPRLSYVGVALAWVLAELGITLLGYVFARRLVRFATWPYLWRPLAAATAMLLGGWVLQQWQAPLVLIIAAGAGIYGAALVLLKGLDRRDLEFARGLLRRTASAPEAEKQETLGSRMDG
jgi:O-antigen/teichoic acid export membrane protein